MTQLHLTVTMDKEVVANLLEMSLDCPYCNNTMLVEVV
jgi:hypothetical protein